MKTLIALLTGLTLTLLLSSCGGGAGKGDVQTMGTMKKILEAKINAEKSGPAPSLEKVGEDLGLAVDTFTATEHWSSTNASPDTVIIHLKSASPSTGIVGTRDGSVFKL